jgi:DNA-binding CsgD family transcriptional regulator
MLIDDLLVAQYAATAARHVLGKLGARTCAEAVAIAVRGGLIE